MQGDLSGNGDLGNQAERGAISANSGYEVIWRTQVLSQRSKLKGSRRLKTNEMLKVETYSNQSAPLHSIHHSSSITYY